jgi:hypothetical protein
LSLGSAARAAAANRSDSNATVTMLRRITLPPSL